MTQQRQLVEQIFTGNSEMARLMRSHDWSQTPLGSVENWKQSLRTIVSVLLNSRYPMFVFWGDKLIKLYNDGYRPILGSTKHPQALGKPGPEVWSEIWDTIGPMVKQVIHQGEAIWSDNLLLFMQRSGYLVELSITDTGVGIPEAELPRLFERFHRVSVTKSRTYEGSGIGLALVQELVKLHNGTIRVTSQVDCGTTFTIALPFGSAHLPPDRIQSTRSLDSTAIKAVSFVEEAWRWLPEDNFGLPISDFRLEGNADSFDSALAHQSRIQTSKSKILLADDNGDMRDYVRRLLSPRFEVETVTNGVAAFNAVQTNLPDLVLTDVMMPEIDGFELLRSLRSNPATQDIPIILLSARAGEEARIEGLEAGADDYLIKPFSARELIARVEATLKLAQLRRTARDREEALQLETQTAKTNLDQIVSSLRDGFITFDRNWRYTYINDRQLEILKLPREAVMGKIVWDLFPDVVETEVYQNFQRAMTEQVAVQFEFYYAPLESWFDHRVYPTPEGIAVLVADVSDRKCIEATLRESEQRFRDMADNAPMMVWVTDPTGYCTYLSRSWYDFSGQTEEAGLGFGWLDATHPDDRESSRTIFLAANDRACAFQLEYRLRRKDGEYRTCIDAARPWFGGNGEFKGYIGSVIDIDDRKQAEDDLRRSEERYRTLFESIDEGFCVVEMLFDANDTPINYRFLEINPVFEQQTGLRQAVGKTVRQLVPDLEGHWIKIYGQVALTGKSVRFENCAEAMNRWFDVYACRTGQPEARKVAIVFKDISERKQAEKALLSIEEQSRNILESITDAFFALDQDWRFTYVNRQAERLLDRTPGDLLGKVIWEEYPGLAGSEFERAYLQAASERVASLVISFYPDHDRWYEVHVYPAADGITVYFRNVTDRKRIEAEREQLLQREQTAREAAENVNRIKDEFLAVLSHELRSPLNPILGWSKLLQQGKLDAAKTTTALATIERNAQLQSQLIEDLLDISRILRGKLSLNVTPVDLSAVILAALETVRLAAEAKSLQLQTTLSPAVGTVIGDAGRLQQVVWNLLSNAVKFTPQGGQITVALTQTGTHAQLQVIDTGKGINSDFLPYVFDHFRQEDGATTRKFGGLGLGLAIARQIVELHGGTVAVDSPGEGQGSTFTVRIPLAPRLSELPFLKQSSASTSDLSGIHILVVDDEPDSRELIVFVLAQANAIVTSVSSGIEAFQTLKQSVPDLVVSDIGMPEMDGYMLLQQIRALEQARQVPAIALTAYAGEFDRQQAFTAGFQRHLAKPIEPDELVKAVGTLVKK